MSATLSPCPASEAKGSTHPWPALSSITNVSRATAAVMRATDVVALDDATQARPIAVVPDSLVPTPQFGWKSLVKRLFDIAVSAALLLVSLPVLVVAAIGIKATSTGPVIFRQTRIGHGGRTFALYKLRTMERDAESQLAGLTAANPDAGPLFKLKDDPRVTRVGKFLRRNSIDELPQLINVLRGEMSLVGPRPALPHEMSAWQPALYSRLTVMPGITGLWQVSGRSNNSFSEYARLDLIYVATWSLWADLKILALTLGAVVRANGAY